MRGRKDGFRNRRSLEAKEPRLTQTGDLVPTCQPVQTAKLAKKETYNDRRASANVTHFDDRIARLFQHSTQHPPNQR